MLTFRLPSTGILFGPQAASLALFVTRSIRCISDLYVIDCTRYCNDDVVNTKKITTSYDMSLFNSRSAQWRGFTYQHTRPPA